MLKMTKSCFLVISFFKFPIVFAGVILTTFHALENLGCYRNIPSQHVFETDGVASVAICASKCTSNVSCLGILYSPEDNVCIGCSVLITVNDSNTYSFMSLESQVSISMTENLPDYLRKGDECQSNANCIEEFTYCIDGFCNCLPEYSFDPVTGFCTPNCTVYGSTYIAHPGHYFQGESIDVSNQKTARDCITWCTNTDTCRGCNHSPTYDTGGWCSMQTSTPRTLPGDFNESGSNFTYYLRNCA
ncbi:uncharacterized protein LOC132744257 [Ruditapes philippinarum]|uniref:uncharacterized protein LOC132744257 n=1 Tax=Ruditapes philippinarum TaxID=129788 RepID=UPI00295A7C8A|nr:uncharacterized protein LOC132744257 [Ruditapes philippinarum]